MFQLLSNKSKIIAHVVESKKLHTARWRQTISPIFLPLTQEEPSSLRIVEQQDPSSLAAAEVATLPSPASQVLDQKEELSKKETVDEE